MAVVSKEATSYTPSPREKELEKQLAKLQKQLKKEQDTYPICLSIIGTWKPISMRKLTAETTPFTEEQRVRFHELLDAEMHPETGLLTYFAENGEINWYGWIMDEEVEIETNVYFNSSWTTMYTIASGEKRSVKKSMKGEKLKMVLTDQDEKCVLWFRRVLEEEEEEQKVVKTKKNNTMHTILVLLYQVVMFYVLFKMFLPLLQRMV